MPVVFVGSQRAGLTAGFLLGGESAVDRVGGHRRGGLIPGESRFVEGSQIRAEAVERVEERLGGFIVAALGAEAAGEEHHADRAGLFGLAAAAHFFGFFPASFAGVKIREVEQGHRAAGQDRVEEALLLAEGVALAAIDVGQMDQCALPILRLLADQPLEQRRGLVMHADLAVQQGQFEHAGRDGLWRVFARADRAFDAQDHLPVLAGVDDVMERGLDLAGERLAAFGRRHAEREVLVRVEIEGQRQWHPGVDGLSDPCEDRTGLDACAGPESDADRTARGNDAMGAGRTEIAGDRQRLAAGDDLMQAAIGLQAERIAGDGGQEAAAVEMEQ